MYHSLKMSKSQRMVMVPEWMAQSMQTKYRAEVSPFISSLSDIEQQIAKLLRNKKLAGDRKMMLYNELLQQYDDIKRQKQKASTPSVRIISDKPTTPSRRSNVLFGTPRTRTRKSRIPIYQTPQRRTPIRRRVRLEDIPEFDEEAEEPLIPFETPAYTPGTTSPKRKRSWKRSPLSNRLSGRWERY